MDRDLAQRRCQPCAPGSRPLTVEAAADLHSRIDPAWALETNQTLSRSFKFQNFRDAFGFASRVALLAEEQGHHPDFEIGWGRVRLALTTHAAGGLTDNDYVIAAKVDLLAGDSGIRTA